MCMRSNSLTYAQFIVLRVSHQVWVSERWGVAVSAAVLVYWQEVEA